jgi:hypothetical protein
MCILLVKYKQLSDMANNDLEKYAKALDKYIYLSVEVIPVLTPVFKCYHEVSHTKDGGSKRYHAPSMEQNLPRHRYVRLH